MCQLTFFRVFPVQVSNRSLSHFEFSAAHAKKVKHVLKNSMLVLTFAFLAEPCSALSAQDNRRNAFLSKYE